MPYSPADPRKLIHAISPHLEAIYAEGAELDVEPAIDSGIRAKAHNVMSSYNSSDPQDENRAQQKERVKAIHDGVADFARSRGLDPSTQWSETWSLARLLKPELISQDPNQ
jgi:hypothetical protein